MKKLLPAIVCVLFFTASASLGRGEPLANDNKDGLYVRSIEQVLRLEPEDVDLATAALIVSEQWSDIVYGRRYLLDLDDMAVEVRNRIAEKGLEGNYRAIAVLNEYLFDELGFTSVKEADDPDDLFLHSVMDRKQGYCLSLSILYLSLGERLGLPLYGVVVPGHFFVRYDDGRVRFNIETTSKGGTASDEHYIDKFDVPEDDGDGIYMINLNKLQTLGCLFNNLGNVYISADNIEQALLALERAIEVNPSLSESHTNLGNVYLKKGRTDDAIYEYRTALRINPSDAKTHNNLGNAYTNRGWLSDAISEYTESIKLDPNFTEPYRNLATAYCQRQLFARAQAMLEQAIVLEPENAGSYSQLADVYSQMENYERAISQYKKALKIEPAFAEAYYGMGVCYNKLGWVDDEIDAYERALAIEPDMVAALANLGNVYFNRQQYDAALEQYVKAIRIKPDDGMIRYNIGAAYSNKKEYQQAVVEYRRAIEIDPEMGDAHYNIAIAFYNLKKYDLAAEHIKTAENLGVEIDKDLLGAIEAKLR